jgi:hypothetical protein
MFMGAFATGLVLFVIASRIKTPVMQGEEVSIGT